MHADSVEVTQDEFFEALRRRPEDIMPTIQPGPYPYTSIFTDVRTGVEFGRCVGVRVHAGRVEDHWYLTASAAEKARE